MNKEDIKIVLERIKKEFAENNPSDRTNITFLISKDYYDLENNNILAECCEFYLNNIDVEYLSEAIFIIRHDKLLKWNEETKTNEETEGFEREFFSIPYKAIIGISTVY